MPEKSKQTILNLSEISPEFLAEEKKKGKDLGKDVIDRCSYFCLIAGKPDITQGFEIKISCGPEHIPLLVQGMQIAIQGIIDTYSKSKSIDNG